MGSPARTKLKVVLITDPAGSPWVRMERYMSQTTTKAEFGKSHIRNSMKAVIIMMLLALNGLSFSDPQPSLKEAMARGKKVYDGYCMACHMTDGEGVPRMNPPLVKTEYVTGDKKRLIGIVLNGMDEPLEINGETYTNVMAPHAFLKDQEIADVLTYIRNSFGNKASAVTIGEVKSARAAIK